MSDIADYEGRITAALERIGKGLGALSRPAPASSDTDLSAELEAERAKTAQMSERVDAIKAKQETKVAALEAKVAQLTSAAEKAGMRLHRHKRRIGQLADINRSLREAVEKNVSDPALVNRAMEAEIDVLRATRAGDADEIDAILGELVPLVEEASEEKADA